MPRPSVASVVSSGLGWLIDSFSTDLDTTTTLADRATAGAKWLFVVDDGGSELVASAEQDASGIAIRRIDPSSDASLGGSFSEMVPIDLTGRWLVLPDGTSAEYTGFADHWHIYAHGFHWIAVSLTYQNLYGDSATIGAGVLLIRFTVDSSGVPADINYFEVKSPASTDDYWPVGNGRGQMTLKARTNDLFMVVEAGGVVIGVWRSPEILPDPPDHPADDEGTLLIHVSTTGASIWEEDFFGSGHPDHQGALGSATREEGAYVRDVTLPADGIHPAVVVARPRYRPFYRILVPTLFESLYANELLLIRAESDWAVIDSRVIMAQPDTNHSMAAEVELPFGWHALVVRRVDTTLEEPDWYGTIVLRLYDNDNELRREVTLNSSATSDYGYRPHITWWDSRNLLIVCWDNDPTAYIWVHELTFSA